MGRDLEWGRAFQAEETASANALRQERARCVQDTVRRPVWLENMRWEKWQRQILWGHVGYCKDSGFYAQKDRKTFWRVLSRRGP